MSLRERVTDLKGKWRDITRLTQYWIQTARIFGLNILILASDQPVLRAISMALRGDGEPIADR